MKIYSIEYYDSDWGDYGMNSLEDETQWWSDRDLVEQMVKDKNQAIIDGRNNGLSKEYQKSLKQWETNERRAKILLEAGETIPTWDEPQEPIKATEIGKWWSCYSILEAEVLDLP